MALHVRRAVRQAQDRHQRQLRRPAGSSANGRMRSYSRSVEPHPGRSGRPWRRTSIFVRPRTTPIPASKWRRMEFETISTAPFNRAGRPASRSLSPATAWAARSPRSRHNGPTRRGPRRKRSMCSACRASGESNFAPPMMGASARPPIGSFMASISSLAFPECRQSDFATSADPCSAKAAENPILPLRYPRSVRISPHSHAALSTISSTASGT